MKPRTKAPKGEHDQAIADFAKAIKLAPDDAEAYLMRGIAYSTQGKKAEAISDFEQCIALSHDPAVIQPANWWLATLR